MPEAHYMIWIANGVLLAFLILAPLRRWPAYLIAGLVAQAAGSVLFNPQWRMNLLLTAMNLAEVLISALLLRRGSAALPRFTDRAYLTRFICYGVLGGPVAMGLAYAPVAVFLQHTAPLPSLLRWVISDGLGISLATPACVAILRIRTREIASFGRNWFYLALLQLVTFAAFSQQRVPMLFLVYPMLVLVLLRMGLGWAALANLSVAIIGSWFTLHGSSPLILAKSISPSGPIIMLQVFIAAGMCMIYAVSVVLESRHATERRLQKIVAQHTLVTENSRDVIVLADFHGNRSYVSPAVSNLLGWSPVEVVKQGSLDLIHPDDLPKAASILRQFRSGAEGALVEARVKKRNGEYIWVEASLRVVRDETTGAPTGILNMVRDISGRKQAEEKLQEAYRAVETLAITDALTGLANRRRFDQCLTTEWRRGLRDHNPLALLLIDVDLFKSYNDTYGHVRGDSCLKQIAEAVLDVVARPGDLVARFGGEEFAVVLPNTGNEGAMRVANDICDDIRRRKLAHSANPLGIMTVSVGCATVVPSFGQHAVNLIELADEALYNAKRSGRNQASLCRSLRTAVKASPAPVAAEPIVAKTA
ncbi:MAG: diguanylate cyclase [Terracidiphilus sp.]|jgi:diguanylate cyclase (GGDEF)-like protein/PAS domain S-box-containing protein